MIAMLTLLRCDGFSVSTLLPKAGTDRGSGDRLVEEAGPAPVAARRRIGNRFPPPPLFLHEPGRFEGTQAETSRLDGCQQTLDVERVRPQTTRRQSVTETRPNWFDSRRPHQSSFHHATVLTIAGDSYRLKAATRHQASRTPQEVPRQ